MRPHTSSAIVLGLGAIFILALALLARPAEAQSSAFSYQGQLKDGEIEVDAGEARMIFRLYDEATGGSQIGSDWVAYPVEVQGGLFTTLVDFGSGPLSLGDCWLEIGVDTSGGTDYTWLSPRQPLTPAPTAVYAQHGGDNPWNISGNDLWYSSGKIGVGTSSPEAPLHIYGAGEDPLLRVVS
jgi:hypothetical protein